MTHIDAMRACVLRACQVASPPHVSVPLEDPVQQSHSRARTGLKFSPFKGFVLALVLECFLIRGQGWTRGRGWLKAAYGSGRNVLFVLLKAELRPKLFFEN